MQNPAGKPHDRQSEGVAEPPVQLWHVLEIHSPYTGQDGRHGKDRRPGGKPLVHLAFIDGDHRQVYLDGRDDRLANGVDPDLDAVQVIIHVAEVFAGVEAQRRHATAD